jgi:hypothetical protein
MSDAANLCNLRFMGYTAIIEDSTRKWLLKNENYGKNLRVLGLTPSMDIPE